jgi:hypothetical protein
MDWAKAKNILIFLFLGLNLVLIFYVFSFYQNDSNHKNISNTTKILRQRGYRLNLDIPNINEGYQLDYESLKLDHNEFALKLFHNPQLITNQTATQQVIRDSTKTLYFSSDNTFIFQDDKPSPNIQLSDKKKLEKSALTTLSDLKLPITDPYLENIAVNSDNSYSISYVARYNKFFIFDNVVDLTFTKKGLSSLTFQCFVNVKGFSSKPIKIIPAYQILLQNFVKDKNKVIDRIDLGYTFEDTVKESINVIKGKINPEWRITMGDGSIRYFPSVG